MKNLIIILGDQLNMDSEVLQGLDIDNDCIWMAEVPEEATHVWSHKARIALFFSAMRHHRDALESSGVPVCFRALDTHNHKTLSDVLADDLNNIQSLLYFIDSAHLRYHQSAKYSAGGYSIV